MSTELNPLAPPSVLLAWLRSARHVVVLTGAGMSAESGITTFRDKGTGLWTKVNPKDLASFRAFKDNPGRVWAWYDWRTRQAAKALPNAGHLALPKLAALPQFESFAVVTQNVDDLHERGGSDPVVHLHGSLFAPRCVVCDRPHDVPPVSLDEHASATSMPAETDHLPPPHCTYCGANVRPGVVWFGEDMPTGPWNRAVALCKAADLVLVVGTSSVVFPAANLAQTAYQRGCHVAVINPDPGARKNPGMLHWGVTAATGLPALYDALSRQDG